LAVSALQTPTLSAAVGSVCTSRHRHLTLQLAVSAPPDTDT